MDLALSSQWLQSSTVPSPEVRSREKRDEARVSSISKSKTRRDRNEGKSLTLSMLRARDGNHTIVSLVFLTSVSIRFGVSSLGGFVENDLGVPQRQEGSDSRRSRCYAEVLDVWIVGCRRVKLSGAVGGGEIVVGWRIDGLKDGSSKAGDQGKRVEVGWKVGSGGDGRGLQTIRRGGRGRFWEGSEKRRARRVGSNEFGRDFGRRREGVAESWYERSETESCLGNEGRKSVDAWRSKKGMYLQRTNP